MGFSPHARKDAGFATPAAVVISLAVATVAIAVQSRAIVEVHAAQADYTRTSAEISLDGVQTLAVQALYGGDGLALPRAVVDVDGRRALVYAEPDGSKLSVAAAGALAPEIMTALGASHPFAVQQGLEHLATVASASPGDVAGLDPSTRWRRCAASSISPYGGALTPAASPRPAEHAVAHVGEVWRLVATFADGWTEDRTVRITGEDHAPARILDRSFYRLSPGASPCPLLAALPPPAPARTATP